MAYRRKRKTTTRRRTTARRRTTSRRRTTRRSPQQTVRIVLEHAAPTLAQPDVLSVRETEPKRARF